MAEIKLYRHPNDVQGRMYDRASAPLQPAPPSSVSPPATPKPYVAEYKGSGYGETMVDLDAIDPTGELRAKARAVVPKWAPGYEPVDGTGRNVVPQVLPQRVEAVPKREPIAPASTVPTYNAAAAQSIRDNEIRLNRPLSPEERYVAQEGLQPPPGTARIQPYVGQQVRPIGGGPVMTKYKPLGNIHPEAYRDNAGALYTQGRMIQQAPQPKTEEQTLKDMFIYGQPHEQVWAATQMRYRQAMEQEAEQSRRAMDVANIGASASRYAADRGAESRENIASTRSTTKTTDRKLPNINQIIQAEKTLSEQYETARASGDRAGAEAIAARIAKMRDIFDQVVGQEE